MKNQKVYSVIVSLIPAIQAILDTFNVANVNGTMRMYIGAGLILLIIILQGIQIYFNPEVKDRALWVSAVALTGYIAGGIIDNLKTIQITDEIASVLRLVFSLIIVITNAIVREYNTVDINIKYDSIRNRNNKRI